MIFHMNKFSVVLVLWIGVILVGCTGTNSDEATALGTTLQPVSTPTAISVQPTPMELTETEQQESLVIWWPDEIAPSDNAEINELLSQQFAEFASMQENLSIDFRLKRAQDVGGILSTLRTASSVAPSALPDLTLLRYTALLTASAPQNRLLQPLEGLVSTAIISDLTPSVLAMGQITSTEDGTQELYGLPYLIDPIILAYNADPDMIPADEWSFEDVLNNEQAFVFPTSRNNALNEIVYLQYLSATPDGIETTLDQIDETALLTVFQFYEDAIANELIDASILSYSTSTDYQTALIQGDLNAGTFELSGFNRIQNQSATINTGLIPTADGTPYTLLNGWMWVIVTSDAERKGIAQNFINWMMETNRQHAYAEVVGLLPSRNSAIDIWDSADLLNVNAVIAMVNNSVLSSNPDVQAELQSTNGRAIHNAFVALINGELSAIQAVEQVLSETSTQNNF